jgi:hypothetical protein
MKRRLHVVELEGLDDRFDLLHGCRAQELRAICQAAK